jgi:hypothetical protein
MADVAPNRRQLDMYCRQARGLCRRWADMADGVGLHTALLLLACWAAATCRHWWLAPDWPQLVDRFVGQLDDPRCAAGDPRALDCERPLPDRGQLRRQLLDGPDRLKLPGGGVLRSIGCRPGLVCRTVGRRCPVLAAWSGKVDWRLPCPTSPQS